jgi:hypothetical protein
MLVLRYIIRHKILPLSFPAPLLSNEYICLKNNFFIQFSIKSLNGERRYIGLNREHEFLGL